MLAILFLSMPVHAVEQAEDDVSRKMIEQVQEAAAGLVSIECDFRQVKHLSMLQSEMVSEGKMYYKAGMLRWEYVAPYDYVFILSGGNAIIESRIFPYRCMLASGAGSQGSCLERKN